MARFTVAENELITQIKDDRLASTLAKIREAIEDLWPSDPVRIVLHYTDHGKKHSERVAIYASAILKANEGSSFSDQEMYLLLAGIYLHDIGMQCDVVRFPEIAEKAGKMGAKFNIKFQLIDGVFSKEMQKSIRKNHQYLSAAWIDLASRTGNTRLGTAIREIPSSLIDDLMDICKYHSQLSIKDCPIKFNYSQRDRKQLVAAVLRFADELDIDAHRVSLETVKNFSIDPDNSVYWWLHNRTSITFITPNVISIILQLHPIDNKNYGKLIKYLFIERFCKKNGPIIDILCENHIPLHISSDSQIKENDRIELLPDYIVGALKKIKKYDEMSEEIDRINPTSDPNSELSEIDNGIALEDLGQYNDALEAYERYIEQYPNRTSAWTNKGIVLRKMGKYGEALASLKKSIKLDPSNVLAWVHKGMVLELLGRYEEAIDVFQNAIKLDSNYSTMFANKVLYLEKASKYKAAMEFKEIEAYLETEKKILDEMEIQCLQKEEATLLSLMDREAGEEAEMDLEEAHDIDLHVTEEQAACIKKAKDEERTAFLKKMDEVSKEETAIDIAESRETTVYLETVKEFLDEFEIQTLQKEKVALLSLLDQKAGEEAEVEFEALRDADLHLIEERATCLKKAKDEERTAFLKKMDVVSKEEKAIEIADSQETAIYLETEKEFLDEFEIQILQKEEAALLGLIDQEAGEEAEVELCDADLHLIEERATCLKKAKDEERTAFLKKMDEVSKEEKAIDIAESRETTVYLETVKEFLDEFEIQTLQKEEAILLSLMDQNAGEEAEIVFEESHDADPHLIEEQAACLKRAKDEARTAFLKKMDEVSKEEKAIEISESQETAVYLEIEKEILDEIEIQCLHKEEAALLDLMDLEADKDAEMEFEELHDIDGYLAEEREAFLNLMDREAREENNIEESLDKMRMAWEQKRKDLHTSD